MKNSVPYLGRFAPSPTGPLHIGSLVAAMASYLDAKVHQGLWLVRIEDVDGDRNVAGADEHILASLQRCGMRWDGDVTWQSRRTDLYQQALRQLGDLVYPCGCSRKEIADSQLSLTGRQAQALIYPGTCRHGLAAGKSARALRLKVPQAPHCVLRFDDRWAGPVSQDLTDDVGDFVIKRADGFWAYQLAVVVDDGAQGITDIVRGADLLDSTPRQLYLQQVLGLPQPSYLHVPVVTNELGEKLSKQTGAMAFDNGAAPQQLLQDAMLPAARFLGMDLQADNIDAFWRAAVPAWAQVLRNLPNPR
ncbi:MULTISPECIES: tRNA glutamyl-Q(34) synthetase GluQRS [unclassified Duganella]|uniref:tRNA glutamyl-Q(34) synthetase GluQRS n=1 Tax=unclassified Duganella TaxID=2636909 RepID=UPI000E347D84|nr:MULTISPECIES: tRNA glutamyl-Q(34) synthetase GluQRS [unclassified Duganella]RFP08663.1 tRNA glutamyl-Q(34) synthetase GluQRS [Duganella sp. BJB475]RFP27483.1 tRNA glutamyl-Q(34) synthetase GluQRS [Duganella sp. BJB476]